MSRPSSNSCLNMTVSKPTIVYQTSRQAKKQFKAHGCSYISETEKRRLERAKELHDRAEKIRLKEETKKQNALKRKAKQEKEGPKKTIKLSPTQPRLSNFFASKTSKAKTKDAKENSREPSVAIDESTTASAVENSGTDEDQHEETTQCRASSPTTSTKQESCNQHFFDCLSSSHVNTTKLPSSSETVSDNKLGLISGSLKSAITPCKGPKTITSERTVLGQRSVNTSQTYVKEYSKDTFRTQNKPALLSPCRKKLVDKENCEPPSTPARHQRNPPLLLPKQQSFKNTSPVKLTSQPADTDLMSSTDVLPSSKHCKTRTDSPNPVPYLKSEKLAVPRSSPPKCLNRIVYEEDQSLPETLNLSSPAYQEIPTSPILFSPVNKSTTIGGNIEPIDSDSFIAHALSMTEEDFAEIECSTIVQPPYQSKDKPNSSQFQSDDLYCFNVSLTEDDLLELP